MELNRRTTIVDIASVVGVSRQTVSRAMNDMPGINADTRRRVLEAARNLGYRPSRFGRGLVKRDQQTVGLMIDNLTNPYYPELAAAIVAQAARLNWSVLLLDTSSVEDQRALLTAFASQADVLIGYVYLDLAELDVILPGVPVVGIDVAPGADAHAWGGVEFELEPGVQEAIDHLQERGVRRPLMLDNSSAGSPTERARVIVRHWADRGVEMPVIATGGHDANSAERAATAQLELIRDADAIMCFNDYVALGAMKALHRAGIRVPESVRMVGLDGIAAGEYTTPALTTLGVDIQVAAEAAVSIARSLVEPGTFAGSPWARVSYRLIVRESA